MAKQALVTMLVSLTIQAGDIGSERGMRLTTEQVRSRNGLNEEEIQKGGTVCSRPSVAQRSAEEALYPLPRLGCRPIGAKAKLFNPRTHCTHLLSTCHATARTVVPGQGVSDVF